MRTHALGLIGIFLIATIAGCIPGVSFLEALFPVTVQGAWTLESNAPTFEMMVENGRIIEINGKTTDEAVEYPEGSSEQRISFTFGNGYSYAGTWNSELGSYFGELTYNGQLVDNSAQFSPTQ